MTAAVLQVYVTVITRAAALELFVIQVFDLVFYRVLDHSNITVANVTLTEIDRRLADYFPVGLRLLTVVG